MLPVTTAAPPAQMFAPVQMFTPVQMFALAQIAKAVENLDGFFLAAKSNTHFYVDRFFIHRSSNNTD